MSSVPPLALDALSLDDLKKLVIQLLTRLAVLEDENRRLRDENARLKALPKRPQLAPGGMDKATEPDKSATRQARRRRKRQSGPRTPPATEERTLVVEVPPGSRRRGFETYTVQDLVLSSTLHIQTEVELAHFNGLEGLVRLASTFPSIKWPGFRAWTERKIIPPHTGSSHFNELEPQPDSRKCAKSSLEGVERKAGQIYGECVL
jgi:hypothetical protein